MLRLVGRVLLGLAMIVVVAATALVGYRAWRQHEGEQALTIRTPDGIDEGFFAAVPGGEQWITIRGADHRNPVLLVVHGGPGSALSPLATQFLPFEEDWTVVQWDQPGAGRTFGRAGRRLSPATTVESIAADGIAVTELVTQRLGERRVVLIGLSFGSVVALEMARQRPDLFGAYVGTGLFVHRDEGRAIVYERVLARAREQRIEDAVAALEAIGPPPHTRPEDARAVNRWVNELSRSNDTGAASRIADVLFAPRQSLGDFMSHVGGYVASDEQFDLGAMDLRKSAKEFALPIFILHGAEDYDTPIELALEVFDSIVAPRKEFAALPNGGHTALVDDRAEFLAELNARVRPLVAPLPAIETSRANPGH
jgi:pimeloyl-ACP methyl ester carboxylesterase